MVVKAVPVLGQEGNTIVFAMKGWDTVQSPVERWKSTKGGQYTHLNLFKLDQLISFLQQVRGSLLGPNFKQTGQTMAAEMELTTTD